MSGAEERLCERLAELALQAVGGMGTMEIEGSGGLRLKTVVEGHERHNLLGEVKWHDTLRLMAFDASGQMLCNVTVLNSNGVVQQYIRGELAEAGRLEQEVRRAVEEMVKPQYLPEDYWSLGRMLQAKGTAESLEWLKRLQGAEAIESEGEIEMGF